jgi:hypothetical protein
MNTPANRHVSNHDGTAGHTILGVPVSSLNFERGPEPTDEELESLWRLGGNIHVWLRVALSEGDRTTWLCPDCNAPSGTRSIDKGGRCPCCGQGSVKRGLTRAWSEHCYTWVLNRIGSAGPPGMKRPI